MLFVLATQVDLTQLSCGQAFVEFKKEYPDNRGSSQDIFCENFEIVKNLLLEDPMLEIGLVPQMDTVSPKQKQVKRLEAPINDYCTNVNPLPDLAEIPISMDLREAGLVTPVKSQGGCGSCYMFQTTAVLENAVLRDRQNLNDFWKIQTNNVTKFALSEQFLLSNAFGGAGYCSGGNFVMVTYIMVPGNSAQKGKGYAPLSTVELLSNFPYDYAAKQANFTAGIPLEPKLAPENQFLPVQFLKNNGSYAAWCNSNAKVTPTILIADEKTRIFNAAEVKRIKSYLARGLAIAVTMDTTASQTFPYTKSSKILYVPCLEFGLDHAVTLVGYGRKEGKEVWVIKNSWGQGWGQKGHFFIEIGSNSYCLEHNAYTVIPKNFDLTETTAYPRGNQVRGLSHTLDCDVFFVKNATKTDYYCYDACPENYPYNEATGQCVVRCASGFYQNFGTMKQCLPACQGLSVVNSSNADSYQCVGCTADSPYFDGTACASRCASGSYNTIQNNVQPFVCVPSCTFYVLNATNADSKTCLSSCPANIPFSDSGLCSARCTSGAYSNATGPLICQDSCLEFFFVNTTNDNSKLCLSVCPATQMTNGKECVFVCPAATPYNDSFNCVDLCASKAYSVVKSAQTLQCQDKCIYYVFNTTNQNSQQCLATCSGTTPYSDNFLCSARCTSGAYSNVSGLLTCQDSCTELFVTNKTNGNSKQCVSACASGQVIYLKECLVKCPTAAQYNESSLCVEQCASKSYQVVGTNLVCISQCTRLYWTNATNNNIQCVTACPSAAPYNDSFACLARCNSGAYSNVNNVLVCQDSCLELFFTNVSNLNSLLCQSTCNLTQIQLNNECFMTCPAAVPYNESKICVERCASGSYLKITGKPQTLICQDSCPTLFVTNKTNSDSKQCVTACAIGQVIYYKECLVKCPQASPYNDSSQCIELCGSKAYQLTGTNLVCLASCTGLFVTNTSNNNSKQCVTACPSTSPYNDSLSCSARCASGAYTNTANILTCQASCPDFFVTNATNQNSVQCVAKCTAAQMTNGKECVLVCPAASSFNDSFNCVSRCASGVYSIATGKAQLLVCQASCPNFFVTNTSNQNSLQCVAACTASQLKNGKECVASCPTAIPFNDTLACAARCASGAYSIVSNQAQTLVCQASCAANFITNASNGNSKQCVSTCPTPLVVSSKECLKTCPSAAPYSDAGACVAKCSSAAYSLISGQDQTLVCKKSCTQYIMNVTSTSKQCFDKCPDEVPYSAAGLCSLRCPAGAYSVISANTQQLVCQASCANYYIVNKTNADSKQCVNPCPSEYMVSGKECVLKCPDNIPYNDSRTCVAKCSSLAYLVVKSLQTLVCQASCDALFVYNTSNGNSKRCLSQCPSEVPYNDSFQCLSQCQSKAYQLISGQFTCLSSCKLYTMNDTNAHKICYDKCPDAVPYADNKLCVSRCPLGAYQDMVCQDSCQNFHVVNKSNQDSFQCFDVCPSSSAFVDGIECKQSCPFYKDSLTKGLFECVGSCTLYVLDGTNQHCVDACQPNQKNKGGQCVLKSNQSSVIAGVVVAVVIVAAGAVLGVYIVKKRKGQPIVHQVTRAQSKMLPSKV
ncbi:Cathepsin_L [Hexamita inflata]|uniref:Cathepsin L n=1 Tax=Hexamita inflata TaxID=28002 RepID=A0AA86QGR8_9EUKA|nr:Cathepsin L [Hexamita inflata]